MKINYDNQKLRFSPVCNHNKYKNSAWCLYMCILCVYYVYKCMPHYLSIYDFQDTCTESST